MKLNYTNNFQRDCAGLQDQQPLSEKKGQGEGIDFSESLNSCYSNTLYEQNKTLRSEVSILADIDKILLAKAAELNLYVDFSDKTYDGDKASPMDRFGLLDYLFSTPPVQEVKGEVTQYWFSLVDKEGREIGKFDISLLNPIFLD